MNTLALELSALIIILRSTGPVISTRRSSRSGRMGATVQSRSLIWRVSGRKSGNRPASISRWRARRRSSSSRRTGSKRRASSARNSSAAGLSTSAQSGGAGWSTWIEALGTGMGETYPPSAFPPFRRLLSFDRPHVPHPARRRPGIPRARRVARGRRAPGAARPPPVRDRPAGPRGRALCGARAPCRNHPRGPAGLPGAHLRGAGGDSANGARRPAALPRDHHPAGPAARHVRLRGRRVLRGRPHPQVASARERAGPAHRLYARPGRGSLQRRGGRACPAPYRVRAGPHGARGSVFPRTPPAARTARGRGVRLGHVRSRGGGPRDLRVAGVYHGAADAAGHPVAVSPSPRPPVPQPIGSGRHRSAVPDGLGPDRPHPPCAAGRPGRVRGAVSPARGSGVRALPASHERPGAGRGADARRVRAGVAAPRELPRRQRVRVVAVPADGERGVSSPPRGTAALAAGAHDRRSLSARAPPGGRRRVRPASRGARSRARRRGAATGRAAGVRAARCGRIPARGDRPAHRCCGGHFEGTAVSGAPAVAGGVEPMMCPDMEVKLNEYVDGTLPAAERALVAAHVAGCAGCRAAVAELQALLAAAGALPKSIPPRRDLWGGVAAKLRRRAPGNVQRAFWTGALAAAAVFAIVVGISRLLPPSTALHRPAGQGWAAVTADYEQSAAELVATLVTERGRLRPETVALVERNLRIIDAAIRESRAALERDPGNAELRQLFAAAYRQKVELLRWATRVATSS